MQESPVILKAISMVYVNIPDDNEAVSFCKAALGPQEYSSGIHHLCPFKTELKLENGMD